MEAKKDISKKDIRWKQRFQNFSRAYNLLSEAFENDIDNLSALEQEGIIQRFEYTFELGWKTFKDYLDYSGIILSEITPRKVIKECATKGIFAEAGIDPEVYLDMMLERNLLSHTYDFDVFSKSLENIKKLYLPALSSQYNFFASKEPNYA